MDERERTTTSETPRAPHKFPPHIARHLRSIRAQADDPSQSESSRRHNREYLSDMRNAAFFLESRASEVLHRRPGCGGRRITVLTPVSEAQAKVMQEQGCRLCRRCGQ
jgi:hypothetical protein